MAPIERERELWLGLALQLHAHLDEVEWVCREPGTHGRQAALHEPFPLIRHSFLSFSPS
jgi:hypothetical protein